MRAVAKPLAWRSGRVAKSGSFFFRHHSSQSCISGLNFLKLRKWFTGERLALRINFWLKEIMRSSFYFFLFSLTEFQSIGLRLSEIVASRVVCTGTNGRLSAVNHPESIPVKLLIQAVASPKAEISLRSLSSI